MLVIITAEMSTSGMVSLSDLIIPALPRESYLFTCLPI